MRWHGSQTIVISSSASPTCTRWPTGHDWTSAPTVTFSRIAPGADADRVQVLLRREQHLAPRRAGVGAALDALAERTHALARLGTPPPRPGETNRPTTFAMRGAYP